MDTPPATPSFEGPLFIVGMPRSGTKLLRELVCSHPAVGIPAAETELLPDWALRWPSFGDLRRPDRWAAFIDHVGGSAYFTFLREEQGQGLDADAWRASCREFSLQGVFEARCRMDGGAPAGGVWGDKSPGYLGHLPLLWRLWPQARVIHIVRDCRDYCLSMQEAWGKDPERAAWRWAERVGAARAAGARRGGQWLELRYEDLLDAPEATMRAVCAFIGRPFDAAVLRPRHAPENLGAAAGADRIVRGNAGRWRERMSPALLARVEAVAGHELQAHGYPLVGVPGRARPPRWRRQLAQLQDGVQLVRFDLKDRGAIGALRFRWRMFAESGALEAR